jgi:DUF1680 family protein
MASRNLPDLTRREFVQIGASVAATVSFGQVWSAASEPRRDFEHGNPLREFDYNQVDFRGCLQQAQLEQSQGILNRLDEDSLLRPFRLAAGLPAPGNDLGGWYGAGGVLPGGTFGQWISALSRSYAISGEAPVREKIVRLVNEYAATLTPENKINDNCGEPGYRYDKIACGMVDAFRFARIASALDVLSKATDAVLPYLPGKAVPHRGSAEGYRCADVNEHCTDECYTLPENQFIAWQLGGHPRHLEMAKLYMLDEFFDPLAMGKNALPSHHAYSHTNALCSAAKAYLTLGDEKYLNAARNGFSFLQEQSFATGGWGPNESFLPARGNAAYIALPPMQTLGDSLELSHASFETPCGAYAHFKLARYLLRITKDPLYGDSMERVMYNTVLGALPLQQDGRAFYYSDYHAQGRKIYLGDDAANAKEADDSRWPCCSGTLPQVAADYRISTYFKDPDGVFVNLYIPSTLRWDQRGAQMSLTQSGQYPLDDSVLLEITASKPIHSAIRLRIPAWAEAPSIRINGKTITDPMRSGTFATLSREWKSGDHIELELPRRLELKPVDAQQPNTVALVCGPVVLFAISDDAPKVTRAQLLGAKQQGHGSAEWHVDTGRASLRLIPFWAIKDAAYFTYLKV